MITRSPKIH